MLEKVIEDLIATYPSEFFDEGLSLRYRQHRIKGRILDLVFEDSAGRLLLIEVKAFALKRQDVGQAGEYFGLMKVEFPEREIRMGVFATSVLPEQRRYLEAIGVEVYILDLGTLHSIAARYNVDPAIGLAPRLLLKTDQAPAREVARIGVNSEDDYLKLIGALDTSIQDRLVAIYAAIKKNPHTSIRFKQAGRAVVSVELVDNTQVDVLFVGVDFKGSKGNPARGTVTFLWKRMIAKVDPHSLRPFANKLDQLLGRRKASIFLDSSEKVGTYDTIALGVDLESDEAFLTFLSELSDQFSRFEVFQNDV